MTRHEASPFLEPADELTASDMPTERQIEYAEDLGITVRPWMTRWQLSDMITAETGDDFQETYRPRLRQSAVAGHVTVERTGKTLKGHQIAAWAMFGFGILLAWSSAAAADSSGPNGAGMSIAALLVTGSILYGIGNRVAAWWHHG